MRFAGYVGQAELPAYLQASDIVALPSITTTRVKETWGLIMNEAMAAGTAVLATDAVGAAAGGLVVDGQTGLVVPEGDGAALKRALERLLGNADERLSLAYAGQQHVRNWSFAAAADAFEAAITGAEPPAWAVAA